MTRLLLIFGGPSAEHTVSIISARSVAAALAPGQFLVIPSYRTLDGEWATTESAAEVLRTPIDAVADKGWEISDEILEVPPGSSDPTHLAELVDVAFPLIHGTFGEDGALQGHLEAASLPYVGAGVGASAVAMDKSVMKAVLEASGIPTAPWLSLLPGDLEDMDKVHSRVDDLGYPVFVKPVNSGSSIGISKVAGQEGLRVALELAFQFDERALVEVGLDAREIECAVLGDDDCVSAPPAEVIPGHEFYDYEDKYFDSLSRTEIPARLDPHLAAEAVEMAVKAFRAVGCSGLARVDLFLERGSDRFYLNEINTLPGFTSISVYPSAWAAAGLAYPELIRRLVEIAVARHGRRARINDQLKAFVRNHPAHRA